MLAIGLSDGNIIIKNKKKNSKKNLANKSVQSLCWDPNSSQYLLILLSNFEMFLLDASSLESIQTFQTNKNGKFQLTFLKKLIV